MHNLISFNQLAYSKQNLNQLQSDDDDSTKVNDYFQCLTDCDDDTQTCKRVCRLVLAT